MAPDSLDLLPGELRDRARALNDRPASGAGEFVLYWMRVAVRAHDNPALDAAAALARELGRPLLVYHALSERYPFASDRHHRFILEGARDVQRECAERGIAYAFHLERPGHRGDHLTDLAARSAAVVTELFPWAPLERWTRSVAEQAPVSVLEVDASCLVPVPLVPVKSCDRAFRFRDGLRGERHAALMAEGDETPEPPRGALPALPFEPVDLQDADLAELVARCDIDHQVGPIPHTRGGSAAGYARWARFRDQDLRSYHRRRNDPLDGGVSRLSAYLHYGQVSPFRIAREAHAIGGPGAEKFLDELLVWRELAWAWSWHHPERDSLDALPGWARETLAEHAADPRPALFDAETLARGRTGDALWDAAQQSLRVHGELHNNLRMTWGKMLPQWTADGATALKRLIDLNHRYALDGRDPNSYGGLLWCLGEFDRPFDPPRPVLGRIRPRDTDTHARRLDVDAYARSTRRPARHAPPRVAVLGAGIAGLAAARTLADHGWAVEVFDKGRRPGGRLATRTSRRAPQRFDHGAPGFNTSDRHLRRHVAAWRERGLVLPWHARREDGSEERLWVAAPDNAALGAHLAADLDVHSDTRIVALARAADGWRLTLQSGAAVGPFGALVLALPAPQARELLDGAGLEIPGVEVDMAPCWSAMLRTSARIEPGFDLARPGAGPLALVVDEAAKPGRAEQGAFTLQTSADFSREHLDAAPEEIAALLAPAAAEVLGAKVTPELLDCHRWRFARALPGTRPDTHCLFRPQDALVLCGDWLGPGDERHGVEAAWLSGSAAAGRLLGADLPGHPYAAEGDAEHPADQADLFGTGS